MNVKDAKKIALIIWEEGYEDSLSESSILKTFPKIKQEFFKLKDKYKESEKLITEKQDNFKNIGFKYKGRPFGNEMIFPTGKKEKQKADKEWFKLYGCKFPTYYPQ